jgi:hypothetical protein
VQEETARVEALGVLSGFRREFYGCLTRRADALFEVADAVLCTAGPELSLAGVHRRGHGAMYDALAEGRIDVSRLRMAVAGLVLPRGVDGQISIALDVTPWPRPDAECSPGRLHCYRPCRCDGKRQTIPGWPYQVAAALGGGRSSWTGPLDAVRLGPEDDLNTVTVAQIRGLLARLEQAGQWQGGDPPVLFVLDSGYDIVRLTWLLRDEPVRLLGRVRSGRTFYHPPGKRRGEHPGRPPRHGEVFRLADPATHSTPVEETTGVHERYGTVTARSWSRLHPRPERRGAWAGHPGQLPTVEGSLIHLAVQHLPGNRTPKPVWLWHSDPDATTHEIDRLWRTYLRRFDLGTHLPVPQANPRTDPAPPAPPRTSRPLGLDHPRRLHTVTPRPAPHPRPAQTLGTAPDTPSAHPRTGPTRLSPHPADRRHPGRRTESHPPRPRPPQRPHLNPRTTPPRRQKTQQNRHHSTRHSKVTPLNTS